jgi:F-type H+-transporting ATPase subunit gamma
MSNTTAALRRKIDGAGDLRGVVRTMKALAASSIGQYQQSVRALADYNRVVELGLGACLRNNALVAAVIDKRQRTRDAMIGVVIFGSDQGLVGQFNDIVVDYALKSVALLPGKPRIWAVGERIQARLEEAGLPVAGLFMVPGSVAAIAALSEQILVANDTHHAELGELHLFYNRQTAGSVYAPAGQRLLPLDDIWQRKFAQIAWRPGNIPEVIGHGTVALRALIREYLFISLFRACAESLMSENASRLSAMERADRNIQELLENLRGSFHRLRQSDIDEELFDVISGFEALILPSATLPQH